MADGEAGIGPVGDDPDVSMGASDGASPANADLDAANSGALSAEVAEKLNKRMDDMRSQMDREREAAATRESKLLEALTSQTGSDVITSGRVATLEWGRFPVRDPMTRGRGSGSGVMRRGRKGCGRSPSTGQ